MKKLIYVAALSFLAFQACNNSKQVQDSQTPLTAEPPQQLLDTYWKLTELNGQMIGEANADRKEVYLILRKAESRVQGNAGCNGYGGTYTLDPNGFNIKFSQMIRTQMACPGLDVENEYLKALELADNYYLKNGELQIGKARMAPSAKFIAIPDKAATLN